MPAKKPSPAKKPARGKKPIGLTSAIGPKATTIVVICVMAGGIAIAARQQQAKAKEMRPAVMSAETAVSPAVPATRAPIARATAAAPTSAAAPVTARPAPAAALQTSAVTISGCLERTGDGFRLKDTAGAAAPKSRSWKSGFLKKGTAAIDVVDASHALSLADQVGRRVSVTGTVVEREMRASALRRLSASCKAN